MGCKSSKQKLQELTLTKNFTFNDYKCNAKCVKVYDGDTITIIFYYKNLEEPLQHRVRMARYDAPELKPHTENRTEQSIELEKQYAENSKEFLEKLILEKIIKVKFGINDKWGRPLVEIFVNGENVNDLMLKNKKGIPYNGQKKISFEDAFL